MALLNFFMVFSGMIELIPGIDGWLMPRIPTQLVPEISQRDF